MNRAIVTITLGKKHQVLWKRICEKNWKKYCSKFNLDLVVINLPLDDSERGKSRSPSWQKCLILSHPKVKNYEQIAWLDSDILINTSIAPNIFENIGVEEIGGVEDWVYPTPEQYIKMKENQNYDNFYRLADRKEIRNYKDSIQNNLAKSIEYRKKQIEIAENNEIMYLYPLTHNFNMCNFVDIFVFYQLL